MGNKLSSASKSKKKQNEKMGGNAKSKTSVVAKTLDFGGGEARESKLTVDDFTILKVKLLVFSIVNPAILLF